MALRKQLISDLSVCIIKGRTFSSFSYQAQEDGPDDREDHAVGVDPLNHHLSRFHQDKKISLLNILCCDNKFGNLGNILLVKQG